MRLLTLALAASALASLDSVQFGDGASEREHGLRLENSQHSTGGLEQSCVQIGPEGYIEFELACSPDEVTYLTVKLWGSDTGQGQLYLHDGEKQVGEYLSREPELDILSGEPAFAGRFFYSTYMLPRRMTEGREQATIRLIATGTPRPYSDDKQDAALESFSRGIYAAATHVDPFYEVEEPTASGPKSLLQSEEADGDAQLVHLIAQADIGIAKFASWQRFGPEWEALVEEGKAPAVMTGCCPSRGAYSLDWSTEEWLDGIAIRHNRSNLTSMRALSTFARAYHAEWSAYYHDDELLDRVAAGLDYYRRAQGLNGGYVDVWGNKWVGGPERRKNGGCLEGFGHRGLAYAFLLAHKQLDERGLLDETTDDDADPDTLPIPRRQAYTDLFTGSRDYLVSDYGRGHAPNQDLGDIIAAWVANECLRILAPGEEWGRGEALGYVYSAVGLAPDIYGGVWVSPLGLAMEPNGSLSGGYCGNYGSGCVEMICELAELTGDDRVRERALQAVDAYSHFRYPDVDAEGRPCLRKEGVITWRNNHTPGRTHYGGNAYAALELNDPTATREAQLYIRDGRAFDINLDRVDAHFADRVAGAVMLVSDLARLLELPPTHARLPREPEHGDFVYADPLAGCVALRNGDECLYISMNWRHGFRTGSPNARSRENAVVNNLARVHFTTPTIDRIANIEMQSPQGFGGLYQCRYGRYLAALNLSPDTAHSLVGPLPDVTATDLVTGAEVDLAEAPTVASLSSLVLKVNPL